MNMSQDIKMQMVDDNVGNQVRHNAVQNDGNEVEQNAVQNLGIQIVENKNGLCVVSEIANQYGNRNVVTAPVEGNGNGISGNPIRCYNCRGDGYYAKQLHSKAKETGCCLSSATVDTLQQASTSRTQSDNAPIYDSDGSTKVPKDENCYDHDIFNMLTHEVQYTDLQTELDRTKEKLENCFIKKENEYAKLWNNWYTKCEECKYDKISYDKAYNDMQQKIKRLQAQLGDHKGNSKDTSCVSDTLDHLPQKLENENVELEFQVWNYEKENAHLKTAYKNLFDSINMTRTQTKAIIDSLQNKLHDTIYENAKLRAQLFNKVSERKDTTKGTSVNTQFCKQSILGKPPSSSGSKLYSVTPFPKSKGLPKIDESHALSKPVTSNSVPTFTESKVVKNDNVISPGIFRINPYKASRVDNFVPNKHVKASVRTKPITVSQPYVITREDVNSNTRGFSPKNIDSTTRIRRPQSRNNPKNARYVNGMKSRKKNQSANVSKSANQKKHKAIVKKSKKSESKESLASPSKPRSFLRWLLTGRIFDLCRKTTSSSNTKSESDISMCDNESASNPQEPTNKGFPSFTSFLDSQNQRDLPRNTPLDRVEVLGMIEKRSKVRKGIVPTEMELVLEQTQQGTSHEVSVSTKGVEE
ncbi:hypothetical protein Tco_0663182 [Tanacetum coccineum]